MDGRQVERDGKTGRSWYASDHPHRRGHFRGNVPGWGGGGGSAQASHKADKEQ